MIFLSCKANARVLLTKTGHGPQLSICFCLMHVSLLILSTVYVLFCVPFMCLCVILCTVYVLFSVLFMCYSVYRLCVCVLFCVPFMYYSLYCLCVFCVLYYCHRVSAHLQFINNNNNILGVSLLKIHFSFNN